MVYSRVSEQRWYGPFYSISECQLYMTKLFPGVRYDVINDDDGVYDAGIL
jgi:hypothetical protein